MNDSAKNILIFVAIVLVLMTVVQSFNGAGMAGAQQERYSDFLNRVEDNSVESVSFDGPTVRYMTKNGSRFFAYNPESGDVSALIGELQERGVEFDMPEPEQQSLLVTLLVHSFPVLLLIAVWIYFMRQMQGGAGGRGEGNPGPPCR